MRVEEQNYLWEIDMKTLYRLGIAVIALTLAGGYAKADTLLFDQPAAADGSHSSSSATGFSQGVTVSVDTQLTSIAMDIGSLSGADFKYLIFDASDSTLLYQSAAFTVAGSADTAWYKESVDYTLTAGTMYYIGYLSDGRSFGAYADSAVSENGIVGEANHNGAATVYANPTGQRTSHGIHDFALDLYGTQAAADVSSVPEPGAIALLGTGLLGLAGAMRRRLMR